MAFLQAVLNGILVGGVYALIGIGLTLIFGVMRVINFAHGELLMLGMYVTWILFDGTVVGLPWLHLSPFTAVLVVIPLLFLWGAFLQQVFVNRVLNALPQNQILLTIGLGLIMSNAVLLRFTADYRILTGWKAADGSDWASSTFELLGLTFSKVNSISFLIAVAITVALYLFLIKTDTGQAIRATAQDRDAAQLMGINVKRMSVLSFGIGSALAGTAGALTLTTYYAYPYVGSVFNLKAFVIVVLGGMGSIIGATLGGILVGVTESLTGMVDSGLKEIVVFALFLALLLFKPSGLLGKSRM